MEDAERYSDEEIARMNAEELIRHDREVLRQALDLLDRLYTTWQTDDGADLEVILDDELYDFLSANHPDWAPDE